MSAAINTKKGTTYLLNKHFIRDADRKTDHYKVLSCLCAIKYLIIINIPLLIASGWAEPCLHFSGALLSCSQSSHCYLTLLLPGQR